MRVRIIYRNYKPLHGLYYSLKFNHPQGVKYLILKPKKFLRPLMPIYRKLGESRVVRFLLKHGQGYLFITDRNYIDADVLHFLQILPSKIPTKPFVVDLEHALCFNNFSSLNKKEKKVIALKLASPMCKKIIPLSYAAKKTLKLLLGDDYKKVEVKTKVVHPALPNFHKIYKDKIDYSIIGRKNSSLKLLFVGNEPYRKGLHETLKAFSIIKKKCPNISLYVVTDKENNFQEKYKVDVTFLKPNLPKEEIIRKLFLPCDIFVLPTHFDTFGMVILDALSCGTPVITTKQFALTEIIRDGYNGFFIESKRLLLEDNPLPDRRSYNKFIDNLSKSTENDLVSDLVSKIEYIYKNKTVLEKMKINASNDFEKGGKFSIYIRNKELKKIYNNALN